MAKRLQSPARREMKTKGWKVLKGKHIILFNEHGEGRTYDIDNGYEAILVQEERNDRMENPSSLP